MEFLFNNCSHLTHNALAKVEVFKPKYVFDNYNRFFLYLLQTKWSLYGLSIPINLIRVLKKGNDLPIENPQKIFQSPQTRKNILEENDFNSRRKLIL